MHHAPVHPPNPLVLLLAPKASLLLNTKTSDRIGELQSRGFEVMRCATLRELYKLAQDHLKPDAPATVLLASQHEENCTAATYLRTLYPGAGIAAITSSKTDAALIQVLQSGADYYCLREHSTPLLVAMLFRLLSRVGRGVDASYRNTPGAAIHTRDSADQIWVMQEEAWVLVSPDGVNIPLTTGERAFLSVLLAAPDKRATHQQLTDAVNQAYALDTPPSHPGRLGVLVSRMRKKFTERGIDMPLRSVHNWGYMFTGAV